MSLSFPHHHSYETSIAPNDINKLPPISSVAIEFLQHDSVVVLG